MDKYDLHLCGNCGIELSAYEVAVNKKFCSDCQQLKWIRYLTVHEGTDTSWLINNV